MENERRGTKIYGRIRERKEDVAKNNLLVLFTFIDI